MQGPSVTIRPFTAQDAAAFMALNLAWIETYFEVETEDRKLLEDPQGHILGHGGAILVAERGNKTVGTVALIPKAGDPATIELCKMAVDDSYRGQGVGRALMAAAISRAKAMGGTRIWLESHQSLQAALKLYQASGFRSLSEHEWQATPYGRCNAQMVLDLSA